MSALRSLARRAPRHGVPAALVAAQWGAVAWVASAAAGSSPSSGLAALVLVQTAILLPLALLAFVAAVGRLAGRRAAIAAGLVWVLLPVVGSRYFDGRSRPPVVDRLLPNLVGLVPSPGFAALVALTVALLLLVRALDDGGPLRAVRLGLVLSLAIALSPLSLLLAAPVPLAFLLERRVRDALAVVAAAAPGLVLFLLWHAHAPGAGAPLFHVDLSGLNANVSAFREYAWSMRVVEWLAIAGSVGLLRSRRPAAVVVTIWFWLAVLLRGGVPGFATGDPSHPSADFLVNVLLPAYPAFALVVAALPLLVPGLPGRVSRLGAEPLRG